MFEGARGTTSRAPGGTSRGLGATRTAVQKAWGAREVIENLESGFFPLQI